MGKSITSVALPMATRMSSGLLIREGFSFICHPLYHLVMSSGSIRVIEAIKNRDIYLIYGFVSFIH